jgi:hypothetical protein
MPIYMAERKRDDADEQRPRKCYNVRDAWDRMLSHQSKRIKNKNNKKTEQQQTEFIFSTSEIFDFLSILIIEENDWKNVFCFNW